MNSSPISTERKRRNPGPETRKSGPATRKGQALVEFALMGLFLGMLLAGAIDLGRAYYTAVVVTNMAGEGAAYASIHPGNDANYPTAGTCSQFSVQANQNIQDRARRVARDRGLIIRTPSQANVRVEVRDPNNNGNWSTNCNLRCAGRAVRVTVTYQIDDLFLPGLLGMNSITIKKSASQLITRDAYGAQACGGS
jgi:Flp pilus assembly protein TadG